MSGEEKNRKRALANTPSTSTYDVGYGKPPREHQFGKGASGNPAGRRKGSRNKAPRLNEERLKTIILEEAYRTVSVRDGDRTVTVPIAQAVIRMLGVKAAKGDHRSQRLFAELLCQVESANKRLYDEWLETAISYKVDWERELDRRARFGIDGPAPLPHPDHVQIDMQTGQVWFSGPATKEEKARYDMLAERKAMFLEEVTALQEELENDPEHPHRAFMEDDIKHSQKILDMIRRVVPD